MSTTKGSNTKQSSTVQKLKDLRLLPPPCNELVPVLSSIFFFVVCNLALGPEGLRQQWKSVVESIFSTLEDPESLHVFGTWTVYMTMYWGYSLMGHAVEHLVPALREFKIQPSASATSWSEIGKMLPLVLFNQIFLALPMLEIHYRMMVWRVGGVANLLYEVPSPGRFALNTIVHVLSVEIWFYTVHRQLHSHKFLNEHVHSIHHGYTAPSWIESVYVHPLEYVLNSFPVVIVGTVVTGAPLIQIGVWVWTVTFLQVHDHAGYCLPFTPRVLMHDFHHQKPNCCFGVIGLMDGIFGTDGKLEDFVQDFLEPGVAKNKSNGKAE